MIKLALWRSGLGKALTGSDRSAVGVCAGWQVLRVFLRARNAEHLFACRATTARAAGSPRMNRKATFGRRTLDAERTLPFACRLLALLTQPTSSTYPLEHCASITELPEFESVAAESGSDIDDDAANLQLLVPTRRARLCVEPYQM